MKKLAWILIAILLFGCGVAEGLDFASMSDDQLQAVIDGASAELAKRTPVQENEDVLIDQNGVKVYLTGNHEVWGYEEDWYLDLEAVVENNSDKTISILLDSASVNGWNVFSMGISDTQAGKKQKGVLDFYFSQAGIKTFEEVEEIEMVFTIYDSDNWNTVATTEPITITF